ncbi:hypothetical protein [Arthrobacter sp. STN4]|uniref:hypothetical protein n=1 Tax=Arthrobacter sp. STN4 TaxID=2923276 RepID=UPI0035C09CE5
MRAVVRLHAQTLGGVLAVDRGALDAIIVNRVKEDVALAVLVAAGAVGECHAADVELHVKHPLQKLRDRKCQVETGARESFTLDGRVRTAASGETGASGNRAESDSPVGLGLGGEAFFLERHGGEFLEVGDGESV